MATVRKILFLLVYGILCLVRESHSFNDSSPQYIDYRDEFINGHARLLHTFLNSSRTKIMPLVSKNQSLDVEFGFELINIVEVNAKAQFITVYGWATQRWNNSLLKWNASEYGGIDTIAVSPDDIWVPDILLYNNIDHQDRVAGGRTTYKTDVVVNSNGLHSWNSPALFKTVCQISVRYFPLDEQNCSLKFGSWTQDIRKLELRPLSMKFPSEYYTQNGEWTINLISLCEKKQKYQCCPYEFDHIILNVQMRRVANDYLINLIIPCCLISSMIFLGFILPPESGERIGLSITVLLAMTVFQQLTSEIMPSYDFPILGQYYFAIVLEISTSIVATTLILNFYHRTHRNMPYILKKVILHWTSRLVFLHDEVKKLYNKNSCSTVTENCLNPESKYEIKMSDTRNQSFRSSRRGRKDTKAGNEIDKFNDINDIFSNETKSESDTTPNIYGMNVYPKIKRNIAMNGDVREGCANSSENDNDMSDEEKDFRKLEWTLAARILDRFVLVISIIIGIITVAAVFLRAPTLWETKNVLSKDKPIDVSQHCNYDNF